MGNAVHISPNASFFAEPNREFEKQIDVYHPQNQKLCHSLSPVYSEQVGCPSYKVKLFTWANTDLSLASLF